MDKLWAPWRKKYLLKLPAKKCIFCSNPKQKNDKKHYIIQRTRYSYSMLNIFPYNNGHIMAVPLRHVKNLEELTPEEIFDLMKLVTQTKVVLDKVFRPHAYNIGINIGGEAGAGFADHLHVHIVPRWSGDTNFMPVVSSTKVIPESLDETYKRVKSKIKTRKPVC